MIPDIEEVTDMELARVRLLNGRSIVACHLHRGYVRYNWLAFSMPYALSMAKGWIEHCRNLPPFLNAPAVFALSIPDLLSHPPCCPAAGLARSTMMAAFRQLTQGEG